MKDKTLDAIIFAVNEKANQSTQLMGLYFGTDPIKYQFYRGQYMAFNEICSLLNNSK